MLAYSSAFVFETPYCDGDDAAGTVGAGYEVGVGDLEVPGVGLVELALAVVGYGEGADAGPGEGVGGGYGREDKRHRG